jgi:hypothetical protein
MGLEPTTPCLQSRCSSQLSYAPGELTETWTETPAGDCSRFGPTLSTGPTNPGMTGIGAAAARQAWALGRAGQDPWRENQ